MSKPTRREFLKKTLLGGVGSGVAMTVLRPEDLLAYAQAKDNRGYAAGKFALELDGVMAGWLHSVEGGHATSDVVTQKIGAGRLQKKPIGNVKYEDISLTCGTGMSKGFYEWIKATLDHQYQRKNGAIVSYDYDFKELSRREFHNALITEFGLSALDAASKDAAKMSIKIKPELTRTQTTTGGAAKAALPAKVQKKWLPSNFRLAIAGLDCTKVNKVEAITVKQKVIDRPAGGTQLYQKEGANVEVPNLVITVPEANAAGFYNWQKESAMSGKRNTAAEKTGQLTYLTEDLRGALFTLTFHNLGIFKLTPEKVEAHNENIHRVKVEMYWQSIQFSYGASAWA